MEQFLPKKLGSFIWLFLKPYKKIVVLYVITAMFAGCWGSFNGLLIKNMINILSSSHVDKVALLKWPAVLLVLNFVIFDNITWRFISYLGMKYLPEIKNKIISETFRYILGSSHQFFNDNLSGRISNQINALSDSIERILHYTAASFIRVSTLLFVALVTMYTVNPSFAYTLGVWFFAFSCISILLSQRLVKLSDDYAESESSVSGQLVDTIANASNVRIFARRVFEVLRLDQYLLNTKKTFQKKESYLLMLNMIQGMLIAIMLGFMLFFLVLLYGKQQITAGDIALILGLSMEVGHVSWFTMEHVDLFNQAVGKCKQSLSALVVDHEITDKKEAKDLDVQQGKISFKNVKFHYHEAEPLFQNKSIIIEPGQKVGLVGYSGGGKSTFVNLILRLYDVTEGYIFIDDQNIQEINQDSLRTKIALIPQDPTLFHRTLMENIRYGNIESSDEQVIDAAKRAHAHEFISQLPQAYDSLVGERGVKLSGGQRQRIAIARAILKNAPILILDEATSQLDSVTESYIQQSLWELMQNKTTIVIAHRLSTLLHMDRILVFDRGKIVEDGTHAELLGLKGMYYVLWNAQVGGFLVDTVREN